MGDGRWGRGAGAPPPPPDGQYRMVIPPVKPVMTNLTVSHENEGTCHNQEYWAIYGGGGTPPQRSIPTAPPSNKFLVSVTGLWDDDVKSCIFERMTVTRFFR